MARNVRTDSADRYGLFVDGEFDDSSENTFTTIDPATGESLGELTAGDRDDVQRAIDAAAAVQPELESMTAFERAELCHEVADAMEDKQDSLAEWLSRDQGKPLEDAAGEIEGGANLWRMAAEDIKRDEPATHPPRTPTSASTRPENRTASSASSPPGTTRSPSQSSTSHRESPAETASSGFLRRRRRSSR